MPVAKPSPTLDWKTYGLALGQRLRTVREAVDLTQEELAHLAGISRNQVQNIENTRNNSDGAGNPKLETLYRLAQALHVPVIALLPSVGVVPPRTALEVTPDAAMPSTAVEVDLEPWLVEARRAVTVRSR